LQSANSPAALQKARLHASQLSGGTSNDSIYRAILQVIETLDLRGSVLDFGAGTGTFTERLVKTARFDSISAADLMHKPADLGSLNWTCADLNDPLPLAGASFDCIVAVEVIEHLENPRALARELFRLLSPGGTVIISTPNDESWRSLISLLLRGHHVAFCNGSYPAHITALVRKDLERIFVEAGFESPQFRFTNDGGLPGRPTTSWQQLSAGLLKGLRFSDNIIAICRKPPSHGSHQ
jgi:2-polyprenyl-3-methyl-5-hydroxy-6-metoxy-1,4-benzoquinol methylase